MFNVSRWLTSLCLQRVLLPLGLLAGAVLRQNGLSAFYLILLLYNPAVPVPSPKTMAGHTGIYQKAVVFFTLLNILATFVFQIVLVAHPPYGSLVSPICGQLERILRYTGLVSLDGIGVWSCIRLLAPEIIMLFVSVGVYASCLKLNPIKTAEDLLPITEQPTTPHQSSSEEAARQRQLSILIVFGKYMCLISLCVAGTMRPSALSGVYYLVFLGSMTWWACNRPLGKPFAFLGRFLLPIVGGHVIALYLYQMQWAQELLPKDAPIARYLGLTALTLTSCTDPRDCKLSSEEWASFLNPVTLLWLYFTLWYEASLIINTPLIRGRESLYKRGTPKRLIQDSMGSVTISEVPEENNHLDKLPEEEEESGPGFLEIMVNAAMTIAQLLTQSSYVGTIIIMMAWSITYHSWLTFVLLLWASIMWLMPNQRRAMLRSSPCLVLYAQFLLLAQYVYGMNLTDAELPQTIQGLNLKQIGFEKITRLPVKPLIIKTLFTVMFWITLKQYNQEKWEARNQSALADMSAPLQIGVSPATSGEAQTKTSQLIQKIGHTVRTLMTKFWIWVVASILFAIGIAGDRITIFRIVYMALALIFILTFQLSWAAWRKMMYGFWLTVIIYSMLILVMTYTYQFDNFPEYWERYLHIPPTLQLDIGLERFETTQLFVKLLTPTFFVVITVVQLYYFHKDFLAISDIKSRGTSSVRPRVSDGSSAMPRSDGSSIGIEPVSDSTRKNSYVQPKRSFHIIETLSRLRMYFAVSRIQEVLSETAELIWTFLELHMLKFIMLSIMLLAIYDVCAMHLIFVLLAVVSMSFGSNVQTMAAHTTSVIASLLLLAKMIYQIKYIDHSHWNVTCPLENTTTYNTAEWIGFNKTDPDSSLLILLKGYIGVILVVTLHSVVVMRQKYQRHLRGRGLSRPQLIFPRITYRDVDKDIKHCLKYLMNYAFYRFGVEISLIAVVTLIGTRMDLYAVLYSFWLCILITPRRVLLSKLWGFFTVFILVTIPLQYVLVVGLPPSLCISYPWEDSETLQRVQEWMYFPDTVHPPPAYKLLCDFIVLVVVCRQGLVFRIERRNSERDYPGGTNKSITHQLESPDFTNPVPDFISHVRSWLDVVKRVVLSAFIWVTLAIVFLAGTNRVNLFSLGYLIGAFIFLWQGNDFYLRPINVILRWWNYLISYNVVVILFKAVLQILGCIFVKEMQTHACWVVQVLGIACIKKFTDSAAARGVIDPIECSVPRGDVGLAWDGFCFGFLILQRRLFNSYYFFHIVDEAKAMAILASRGAELIEELSQKQIQEQQEAERKILEKIKYKMDRIKASQQKIQGPSYKEPPSHAIAIRSGDYYMFDDPDDEELDLINEQDSEGTDSDESDEINKSQPDVFKLLSSALKTDIEKAATMSEEVHKRRVTRIREGSTSAAVTPTPGTRRGSEGGAPSYGSPSSSRPGLPRHDSEISAWRSCSSLPDSPQTESKPGPSGTQKDTDSSQRGDDTDSDTERDCSKSITLRFHDIPDGMDPGGGGDDYKHEKEGADFPGGDEEPKEQTLTKRIITLLRFLWAFITSVMVTITRYLNRFSRDYRYVMRTLSVEKKQLKERMGFGAGVRTGSTTMWQPLPQMVVRTKASLRTGDGDDGSIISDDSSLDFPPHSESAMVEERGVVPSIRVQPPSNDGDLRSTSESPVRVEEVEEEEELSGAEQVPIVRLVLAIWFAVISHSELVCYFIIFVHQIRSPTILSLPLPLMVFLWGTLTVPRPSTTFWVTIIAYTELVVMIKCMFQFEILPWNQQAAPDNAPFFAPRIIGIERQPGMYAYYDLLLLLVVFFHRSMLKSLGLWKATVSEVSSESTGKGSRENGGGGGSKKSSPSETEEGRGTPAGGDATSLALIQDSKTEYFPSVILPISTAKFMGPVREFFESLLTPSVRVTADVYAYMFFCDFFNFLVVIFGFASFGSQQGDGGVSQYFEENKVPVAFLVMLILQFGLIIVDRTLYLRKFILGKVIFQFILVIGIHIWMFFVLPAVTDRQFNANTPPQMWYMVKCFYLLLSAYQIRSGYPTRILGNFLCKSYNYLNMFLFKVFMGVPFVFELRALMDWIWTDTSMTLSDWLKMEDIFAHIFQLKCQRRAETEYPQARGEKKASFHKYLVGGGCLVGIIAVIWFPLVLFALGNTVGQPNLPYDVTISVRIGAFQPIYRYSAQNNSIYTFNSQMWDEMGALYKRSRVAQTFLSNYEYEDVGVVKLSSHSTSIWTISPPDNITLIEELQSNKSVSVKLEWIVSRKSTNPEQPGVATNSVEMTLSSGDTSRKRLVNLLTGHISPNQSVILPGLLPKFVKVTSRGTANPISQLMSIDDRPMKNPYRNLTVTLNRTEEMFWWELSEECKDPTYLSLLKDLPYRDCDSLVMYTFNDKAFPATLNIISGKGIIGLYTTFVLIIHSIIRGFFTGISFKIMFDDMPNVDRILQLCLDIYLVRESGELDLEEDLFAKLVFLYRSPETLIKWTRPPDEEEHDDDHTPPPS